MTNTSNSEQCPLCSGKNQCAVNAPEGCWCTKIKIPNELIKSLPENKQGVACICEQCVKLFQARQLDGTLFSEAR